MCISILRTAILVLIKCNNKQKREETVFKFHVTSMLFVVSFSLCKTYWNTLLREYTVQYCYCIEHNCLDSKWDNHWVSARIGRQTMISFTAKCCQETSVMLIPSACNITGSGCMWQLRYLKEKVESSLNTNDVRILEKVNLGSGLQIEEGCNSVTHITYGWTSLWTF